MSELLVKGRGAAHVSTIPGTGVDGPQTSPPAPGASVGHPVELGPGGALGLGGALELTAGEEIAGTSDVALTTEGTSAAGADDDDDIVEKEFDDEAREAEAEPTEA